METTVDRIDNENVEISFTIPKEEVDKAVSKVYQQIANSQNIKGFRKGKVPRDVIRKLVGFQAVADMSLEDILSKAYMEACDKNDVFPVGQPDFEPWPVLKENEELNVKVKVKALPEFEICGYDEIPVPHAGNLDVTDEEIATALGEIKQRVSDYAPLAEERGCMNTDEVKINYEAFEVKEDGTEQRSEKRDGASVKLGAGATLPEIEENLLGMKVGEKKSFTIEFAADYPQPSLAGKKARYAVEVVEIKMLVPIETDEALIAKLGEEVKDIETLKGDIRNMITSQKQENIDKQNTMAILAHVVSGTNLEVPQELVDNEMELRFGDLENMLEARNKTLDDYAAEIGKTLDEMKAEEEVEARFAVKRRIVLNRIFSKENIEVLPHELERALISFAMENRMGQVELKKLARNEEFISNLRQRLREAKVMTFLKNKVVYSDGAAAGDGDGEAKDAPAPKKAKKAAKPKKKADVEEKADAGNE